MLRDRPFVRLVHHFFAKFFDNDWAPPGNEITATMTQAVGVLATPGLLLPVALSWKYAYLFYHSKHPAPVSWPDKYMFVTFAMVVIGVLTVLEWDCLFPDLRDFHVLTPLPLRPGAMLAAQVCALLLFLLLFSVAVNGPSSIGFPMVAAIPEVAPGGPGRFFFGHAAAVFCASAFVFFSVLALEGILLLVLTPRAFRQASPYFQFTTLCLLAALFLLYSEVTRYLPVLHHDNLRFLRLLPTVWFLGLYETLIGSKDPLFLDLGRRAVTALAAVTATAAVSYVLAYRRHARRSLEAAPLEEGGPSPLFDSLARALDRWLLKVPAERAVFHFLALTLNRSRKHKLLLAIYAGIGCAVVLETMVAFYSVIGPKGLSQPGPALLSIPLVLSLFLLSGLRLVFTIPAELTCNWVFRMAEVTDWRPVFSAARKAMMLLAVIPLFVSLLPFYVLLWGWTTALLHTLFGFTLSIVLMEILLATFRKVPFTCSYLPGKAKVSQRWAGYWLFFVLYCYAMTGLEQMLLASWVVFVIFLALMAGAYIGWRSWQEQWFAEDFRLIYEDEPEPAVLTLDLSGG